MAITSKFVSAPTLAVVAVIISVAAANINITSPIITNWGVWGRMEYCPSRGYAQGFQLRTEGNQMAGDDTALNAIRLFCGDPYNPNTVVVSSSQGQFGDWGRVYSCYPGTMTGFQLRSESSRGSGDDTAANNIRFWCSESGSYTEGDGMSWGDWTTPQHCYGGQRICSIQTQVEPYQGSGDDSSLNNVRFECCDPRVTETTSDLQQKYSTVKDLNIWGALPFNPKLMPTILKHLDTVEGSGV